MSMKKVREFRAYNQNERKLNESFRRLQSCLNRTGKMGKWFALNEIPDSYFSELETSVTDLGRARGTVSGSPESAKLKQGNHYLNSISRRIFSAFGGSSKLEGDRLILERRQTPNSVRSVQYRLTTKQVDLPLDDTPLRVVTTTFQKKLGAERLEYKPKTSGKDTKEWLSSEILAAVDIYVDELMEENRQLRKQLAAIKELLNV